MQSNLCKPKNNRKWKQTKYYLHNTLLQLCETLDEIKRSTFTPLPHLNEHKSPIKDLRISSLISIQTDSYGHSFNWENVMNLDRGYMQKTKKFPESWHSDQSSINKYIEVNAIHQLIRKLINNHNTMNRFTKEESQMIFTKNDWISVSINQSNIMLTKSSC